MWFLTLELWPYVLGALAIGLITGWLSGCAPRKAAVIDENEQEAAR